MTIDSAISTTGLTKHYPGVQALTDLSLEVPAGTIYGFLGPQRRGQVDDDQGAGRPHPADAAAAPRSPGSRSPPAPPIAARSATSPRNRSSTTG